MIRIKMRESYNLAPVRALMKKWGFEEFEGYLTDLREYFGTLMFRSHGFTAVFGYPAENVTFVGEKGASSIHVNIKNIKKVEVCAAHVDVHETNGSVTEIWN